MQDGLAGIRHVLAERARDRRGDAPRLVRREPAELDRGHGAVAGRPRPLASEDAAHVVDADEPLVVARQSLDRGSEQPRHAEDALRVEALAARMERQLLALELPDDSGPQLHAGGLELRGHRGAHLVAEEGERGVLRRDHRHLDVVVAHRERLTGRHQRELVRRQRPDGARRDTIAIRFT